MDIVWIGREDWRMAADDLSAPLGQETKRGRAIPAAIMNEQGGNGRAFRQALLRPFLDARAFAQRMAAGHEARSVQLRTYLELKSCEPRLGCCQAGEI